MNSFNVNVTKQLNLLVCESVQNAAMSEEGAGDGNSYGFCHRFGRSTNSYLLGENPVSSADLTKIQILVLKFLKNQNFLEVFGVKTIFY